MERPILFILAGPNGAGKTTFYETALKPRVRAPFINADRIQADELREDDPQASYEAARLAAERRTDHFKRRRSFVTETVFSHPSKLDLIGEAQAAGFQVILFHIQVSDPLISIGRVRQRFAAGGHDVPADKIRERYRRNQALIRQAALISDSAMVYDNSGVDSPPRLLLRFAAGRVVFAGDDLPDWCRRLYGGDISGGN